MTEVTGRYNTAKIYSDTLEASAEGQIRTMCDQPFTVGSKIRIMPDVHAGKGCTIGTTMTIGDKVVPNLVGVDIGCGMETAKLKTKRPELPKLDSFIRQNIPSGMSVREKPHEGSILTSFDALKRSIPDAPRKASARWAEEITLSSLTATGTMCIW